MCGILGLAGTHLPDDATVARVRDLMTRRGPDGAGLWRAPGIVLAHRRLAVVDPTPAGDQPMTLPDGSALVYNGELYNDAELRADLASRGRRFNSGSDAETVLHAMALWGIAGLHRLRGMFALAFFDAPGRRLILARDPFGIKPLFYRLGAAGPPRGLAFASDIRAILACPGVEARADVGAVSGYLTTIRTTLGNRTLFDGVLTLRPGEVLTFDLAGPDPRLAARERVTIAAASSGDVRAVVEESIVRHLRSDVPICCLLSGGLDSSIIASVARRHVPELFTYCSGSPDAPPVDGVAQADDFGFARRAAAFLGTRHTEAPVSRELFAERWPWMVETLGMPLSTPNETAIHEVSRRLRADGRIVALSGEGADELFGGYDRPLTDAAAFLATRPEDAATSRFLLDSAAWMPIETKHAFLQPGVWRSLEGDAALVGSSADGFADAMSGAGGDQLQACLRHQRIENLTGLLGRLDSASMLAGVEGRTPLADAAVAALAESLPMSEKFVPPSAGRAARTKVALREAFARDLPPEVVARPKASFPLPFQEWVGDHAAVLHESAFARGIFTEAAIATVAAKPRELWRFAWPMINLAMWGRYWWG